MLNIILKNASLLLLSLIVFVTIFTIAQSLDPSFPNGIKMGPLTGFGLAGYFYFKSMVEIEMLKK